MGKRCQYFLSLSSSCLTAFTCKEVSGYEISAFDSIYNLSLAEISIPKNIAANSP